MRRAIQSRLELQEICLKSLKTCPGFEKVNEILVQPRNSTSGGANWTVAAVRPRVDNEALRGARATIDELQRSYQLCSLDVQTTGRSLAQGKAIK